MIPLFVCVVLITLFLRYLRSRVIVKAPALGQGQGQGEQSGPKPEDFIPDYEKAHQKFGKQRQQRRERAQKELEDKIKAQEQNGMFSLFDQDMEWLKAKRDYERAHPLRKPSRYEGALALFELKQEEQKWKAGLAKIKRDIFEKPAPAKASSPAAPFGTGTSETTSKAASATASSFKNYGDCGDNNAKDEDGVVAAAVGVAKVAAELRNLIRQRRENKSSSSSGGSKSNFETIQGGSCGDCRDVGTWQ